MWYVIHFALLFAAMWIVRSASERELIEMIGSPFISFKNRRDPKVSEKLVIWVMLLLCTLGTYFVCRGFAFIQPLLLSSSDQLFISTAIFFIPAAFVTGCMSLLLYCFVSKQSLSLDSEWKSQPSVFEAHQRFQRLKRRFSFWSFGIQVIFTLNMLSYAVLDDKGLVYSPYYSFESMNYSYDNVEKANIYVTNQFSTERARHKQYPPHFEIHFKSGHCLELWNNVHYSKKEYDRLKNVLRILKEKEIEIEVPRYSLSDHTDYREHYSKAIYKEIKDFLNYATNVRDGMAKEFAIGEAVTLDSVTYRVDSTGISEGEGFYKTSDDKHYKLVYLTIENAAADTFLFSSLINLKLIDSEQNEYIYFNLSDQFENRIPPKTSHHGSLSFSVPDTAKEFKMCYKEGIFNPHFLWFDLTTLAKKKK